MAAMSIFRIVIIASNARRASPLLDACHALFAQTADMGLGQEDMVAVVRALEARTEAL